MKETGKGRRGRGAGREGGGRQGGVLSLGHWEALNWAVRVGGEIIAYTRHK